MIYILHNIIRILKDKKGTISILSMLLVLCGLIAIVPIYAFAECNARISMVKEIPQNAIDVYTIKTGKDVMNSVKNGNDYTDFLNKQRFVTDMKNQLDFTNGSFDGYDSKGNIQLAVNDINVEFITDNSLKTKVTYTITYTFYFMSKPLITSDFDIVQHSRYNPRF